MLDARYDEQLSAAPHLALYPNLMPWVGAGFASADLKVLLLVESHYLMETTTYHHDAEAWYAGVSLDTTTDIGWMRTRSIIRKGIELNWAGKSKTIYRNLSTELQHTGFGAGRAPFESLAYMNFFQRPAEKTGDSIQVKEVDRKVSSATVAHVVACLRPNLVVFCRKLAWRVASDEGLVLALREKGIAVGNTPHPASAWWNRASKKRGGRNGRQVFNDLLKQSGFVAAAGQASGDSN